VIKEESEKAKLKPAAWYVCAKAVSIIQAHGIGVALCGPKESRQGHFPPTGTGGYPKNDDL
jgi:hypothetical protein